MFPLKCIISVILIRNMSTLTSNFTTLSHLNIIGRRQTHNPETESRILPLTSGERKRQKVSTMYDVISVCPFICLYFYLSVCLSVCMSGQEVCCLCCSTRHEELSNIRLGRKCLALTNTLSLTQKSYLVFFLLLQNTTISNYIHFSRSIE